MALLKIGREIVKIVIPTKSCLSPEHRKVNNNQFDFSTPMESEEVINYASEVTLSFSDKEETTNYRNAMVTRVNNKNVNLNFSDEMTTSDDHEEINNHFTDFTATFIDRTKISNNNMEFISRPAINTEIGNHNSNFNLKSTDNYEITQGPDFTTMPINHTENNDHISDDTKTSKDHSEINNHSSDFATPSNVHSETNDHISDFTTTFINPLESNNYNSNCSTTFIDHTDILEDDSDVSLLCMLFDSEGNSYFLSEKGCDIKGANYDCVSVEIEEGDSVFGSDYECSSLSVSESDIESSQEIQSPDTVHDKDLKHDSTNVIDVLTETELENSCLYYLNCGSSRTADYGMIDYGDGSERELTGQDKTDSVKFDFLESSLSIPENRNFNHCEHSKILTVLANDENTDHCFVQTIQNEMFSPINSGSDVFESSKSINTHNDHSKEVRKQSGKSQREVTPVSNTFAKYESFYDSSSSSEIKKCIYCNRTKDGGSMSSESNDTNTHKSSRPLTLQLKSRKRATVHSPETERTKSNVVLSPDVVEGVILNLAWVDRVNRAIVANTQQTVSTSNEDLIKYAKECRIMKRFSQKESRFLNRPKEKVRKRSPSDARHDRHRELEDEANNCYCNMFKNRDAVNQQEVKSGYLLDNNSDDKCDCHAISGSHLLATSSSKLEKDCVNGSTMSSQIMRPRLPRKTKPTNQQNYIIHNINSTSLSEQAMNCSVDELTMNGVAHKDVFFRRKETTNKNFACGINENTIDSYTSQNAEPGVGSAMEPIRVIPGRVTETHHGLIRKPAVRRKGYAWMNKGVGKNSRDEVSRPGHRKLCQGSSLDLAPSLLNIFDRTISSGKRDTENGEEHPNGDRTLSKTQSLPAQPDDEVLEEVQYRNPKLLSKTLPPDRANSMMMDTEPIPPRSVADLADNKKRPLSISSMSSTSLNSSPRVRKKRASTFNGDIAATVRESYQNSKSTIVQEYKSDAKNSSGPRQSVDSGCVEGYKNGDKCFDSMSVTSSENGSLKDETDSSVKDDTVVPSSRSEKTVASQLPKVTKESSIRYLNESQSSHSLRGSIMASNTSSSQSTKESKQHDQTASPKHKITSIANSEKRTSYNILSGSDNGSNKISDNNYRSFDSPARNNARIRFFSNYEQHMRHTSPLRAPIGDEVFDNSPCPQSPSPSKNTSVPHSSNKNSSVSENYHLPKSANDSASSDLSKTQHYHVDPSQHFSPENTSSLALKSENHRDHSSKLSPSSERGSQRSDRSDSVSRNDRKSTSPRLSLSRTTKKRDPLSSTESGSKSSSGYVSYVYRVVTEIIESERTYIASLEDIIHGYLEPMEKILHGNEAKKDIMCLFSNIREIYQFGCLFLGDLEKAGADPVKVAQCFVKYNKGFVIYTDYCTNYPRAVEVLTRFMQHQDLSQLCKERQLALGHGLPLGAYLLKPVQRILKYHLLLHNIVKNCEKEKDEAAILEQAFQHMTQMAHHINEMKRKHEHAVRIQEIQSQLEDYVGEDLTRLGELVLEGTFKVSGAKASRQVFLFERGFLISKIKEGGMLSCKTFIKCTNLMLVEVIPNEPLSFHIIPFDNPRAQDTLQARNMEQKRRWCHDIKRQILESFKGIPDNAKNLIMQLGKDHVDEYISKDSLDAGRRNHTAPEYLEKRRFRRKSGSRLPDFSLLKPQKTKKGGNKKNEVKSREKMSAETNQRSQSRSPEVHRHSKKHNIITKKRSPSTSSSSTFYIDDQPSNDSLLSNKLPTNLSPGPSSPKSECTSPDRPVFRRSPKKLTLTKDGKLEVEAEGEVVKRPVSFLMARANPILSQDITHLVARYKALNKISSSSMLEEKEQNHQSFADFPDMGQMNIIHRSDIKEFSSNNELNDVAEERTPIKESKTTDTDYYNDNKIIIDQLTIELRNSIQSFENKAEISGEKYGLDKNTEESNISNLKSKSLPDLNRTKENKRESDSNGECQKIIDLDIKNVSQSAKNVHENYNIPKGIGRLSRKDMQFISQIYSQNGKNNDCNPIGAESWRKEHCMLTSKNACKRNANENNLLKKTVLRLPKTSELLLSKEKVNLKVDETRFKLHNSEGKLTRDSLSDMSHFDENSMMVDSFTSSRSSIGAEALSSSQPSLSVIRRQRGQSDVSEMFQLSNNKEHINKLHPNRASALKHSCSFGKDKWETKEKFSSQNPYATPPREYMTLENMKRFGSMKDTDKSWFNYSDSLVSNSGLGSVNAFGISPVTVTVAKPVSFNSSNLLRSQSTPIPKERHNFAENNSSKGRPVSMDLDKLTEESYRLIAEMEEYISNSSENVKITHKFPTSLPVEEDGVNSNRLSMISSISTSSYESQGSSSSDGLVGTLKSKLRAWARLRNDSEFSYTSTFSSDDEDQDEYSNSESSSALELHAKNCSLWKENCDVKHINHELGSEHPEPIYSTEYHLAPLPNKHTVLVPTDQKSSYNFNKFSIHESHQCCGSESEDMASEKSDPLSLKKETQLVDNNFSPSIHTETLHTNMPPAEESNNFQHPVSNIFYEKKDQPSNKQTPLVGETEGMIDLSTEPSEGTNSVPKLLINSNKPSQESLDFQTSVYFQASHFINELHESDFSLAVSSKTQKENSETCELHQDNNNESEFPRKSIREYVQDFEEKTRAQSQKVVEVKRREPGVMIRQRLEHLKDSVSTNRCSSCHSSSRPASEERDFSHSKSPPSTHYIIHKMPVTFKKIDPVDTSIKSICSKLLSSKENLSKSEENLSKFQESTYHSRSKENFNSLSDIPRNRLSTPINALKLSNQGHEKHDMQFNCKSSEIMQSLPGNQFIHRAHTSLQEAMLLPELAVTDTQITPTLQSNFISHLDEIDPEGDNLVMMKGWVRALISKFQEKQ